MNPPANSFPITIYDKFVSVQSLYTAHYIMSPTSPPSQISRIACLIHLGSQAKFDVNFYSLFSI